MVQALHNELYPSSAKATTIGGGVITTQMSELNPTYSPSIGFTLPI